MLFSFGYDICAGFFFFCINDAGLKNLIVKPNFKYCIFMIFNKHTLVKCWFTWFDYLDRNGKVMKVFISKLQRLSLLSFVRKSIKITKIFVLRFSQQFLLLAEKILSTSLKDSVPQSWIQLHAFSGPQNNKACFWLVHTIAIQNCYTIDIQKFGHVPMNVSILTFSSWLTCKPIGTGQRIQ